MTDYEISLLRPGHVLLRTGPDSVDGYSFKHGQTYIVSTVYPYMIGFTNKARSFKFEHFKLVSPVSKLNLPSWF